MRLRTAWKRHRPAKLACTNNVLLGSRWRSSTQHERGVCPFRSTKGVSFSHRAPRSRPRRPESRPPCRAAAAVPLTRRLEAPLSSRWFQGGETSQGPPRQPQLLEFRRPKAAWTAGQLCPGNIRLTQLRCRPGQARCKPS